MSAATAAAAAEHYVSTKDLTVLDGVNRHMDQAKTADSIMVKVLVKQLSLDLLILVTIVPKI